MELNIDSNLLTLDESAALVGLSRQTIYNKVRAGELPARRIKNKIYIDKSHMEAIIKGQEYAPRKNNRPSN